MPGCSGSLFIVGPRENGMYRFIVGDYEVLEVVVMNSL